MSTTPLTLAELSKAQAEAEGFSNGPAPTLNQANLYVQDCLVKIPQVPGTPASTVPYYPSSETPNFQLTTDDMPSALANNFVILDTALGSAVTPGSIASYALVKTTVFPITSAQLLNLLTTPVLLLPGIPGTWIQMISCAIEYIAGSIPYTVPLGMNLNVQLGLPANTVDQPFASVGGAGFLDQTTSQVAGLINAFEIDQIEVSTINGVGAYLVSEAASNLTAGNGTLKITVSYNSFAL